MRMIQLYTLIKAKPSIFPDSSKTLTSHSNNRANHNFSRTRPAATRSMVQS